MDMYKTKNLDVASYLYTKGMEPKIKRFGVNNSLFTFADEKAESEAKKFLLGNVVTNISKYLFARVQLKRLCGYEEVVIPTQKTTKIGQPYWYIVNKTIMHAVHGSGKVHNERLSDGNYYLEKKDAEAGLKD